MKDNMSFFKEKLIEQYGESLTNQIIKGLSIKRFITLRVNTLKITFEEVIKYLDEHNVIYDTVDWSKAAIIIKNMNLEEIRNLEIYKDGKIYLQSLSSMLPVIILNPKENDRILDMAAAPGSKTTQIAALTNNKALITAIEKDKIRCSRLKYNLEKQAAHRVTILNEDATKLNEFYSFDKILLDSPCSGSGTLYLKDENNQFSINLINKCKNVQYQLLEKAINLLKPGKEMVYSTCSILKEENEDILNKILKNNNIEIIPINKDNFKEVPILPTTIDGTLCVMPSELYEGFFIAKIRKK